MVLYYILLGARYFMNIYVNRRCRRAPLSTKLKWRMGERLHYSTPSLFGIVWAFSCIVPAVLPLVSFWWQSVLIDHSAGPFTLVYWATPDIFALVVTNRPNREHRLWVVLDRLGQFLSQFRYQDEEKAVLFLLSVESWSLSRRARSNWAVMLGCKF